jgi:hypothetical protein
MGETTFTVYLIAANDGQLVEAWVEAAQTAAELEPIRQAIEDLLVGDLRELEGFQVKLYNLSRQSAAVLFPRILDAVLNHPVGETVISVPIRTRDVRFGKTSSV